MKLRAEFQDEDFELGEVVDADVTTTPDGFIKFQAVAKAGGRHTIIYDTLERFYGDWEDAPKKPKVGYIIDPMEEDYVFADDSGYEDSDVERAKELGIWFESEGGAKKAVKKLKAWQRMKDTGCKPIGWRWKHDYPNDACYVEVVLKCQFDSGVHDRDLDLLFGGEE